MSTIPDVQQRTVATVAGESSNDHSQGQNHSAINTHVLSVEATVPPYERPDGSRIKVRFLPDTHKVAWKKLDTRQ